MGSRVVSVNKKLLRFGAKKFLSQTDVHEVFCKSDFCNFAIGHILELKVL